MQRRVVKQLFAPITFLSLALGTMLGLAPLALADGDANGDPFRETAQDYEEQAEEYQERGNSDVAAMYYRLAEIKYEAAELADEGRWDEIDWTEYEELREELYEQTKK